MKVSDQMKKIQDQMKELKTNFELYIGDLNIPLEERWKTFINSPAEMKNHDHYGPSFTTLPNDFVIKKAKNEDLQEERAYRDEQRNHCLFIELEMMIGKPVISISNEWNNPIIGFGKRIEFITRAKTPVLIIEDYVSGNDMMVLSVPFYFSEQRLFALSKLDPFEICSIIYKNSAWMEPFEKVKSGVFEGYDVIINRLKQTDFFERSEKARNVE